MADTDNENNKNPKGIVSPLSSAFANPIMDKMKIELDELTKEIIFLPIKLEVYDQIKERNFWQYFWSLKWMKK